MTTLIRRRHEIILAFWLTALLPARGGRGTAKRSDFTTIGGGDRDAAGAMSGNMAASVAGRSSGNSRPSTAFTSHDSQQSTLAPAKIRPNQSISVRQHRGAALDCRPRLSVRPAAPASRKK